MVDPEPVIFPVVIVLEDIVPDTVNKDPHDNEPVNLPDPSVPNRRDE